VPVAVRVIVHVAALAAGLVVGVLGSFVHPLTWAGLPYGLLLGLALTGSLVATGGLVTRSRSGALVATAGWLLAVGTMSLPRPEGDLIVPATALGYAWLLGGTLVAGLAMAVPYRLLPGASHGAPADRGAPSGAARIGR
jgi:N-acetyl-1-D-myo-inositol-2-amino-2-deoxy-alpha-D-glucopyranoside deacetylase